MGFAVVNVICPTCGKPYTVRKFCHSIEECDQFAAYVQSNTRSCQTCYHSMINQEAFTTAQNLGLPPLVGTLAQIKWATVIRHTVISQIVPQEMLANASESQKETIRRAMAPYADAAWWIKNREVFDGKNIRLLAY